VSSLVKKASLSLLKKPAIEPNTKSIRWRVAELWPFEVCARDSIICYSAHNIAIARSSICPSVCLSHGWISQKRLKLGSCNFHHQVSLVTLVSSRLTSPRNSKGNLGSEGAK